MVIVGAGEAGARAAFALREAGWRGPITPDGSIWGHPNAQGTVSEVLDQKPKVEGE